MNRIRMLSYVGCMGVLMSAALLFGCANDVVGAIPDTTPPAEVTNLVVSAGDSSITVSWNEPVDSDFAKVEILYSGSVIATIAKGTFLTTASNLTNGITYTFTVRTVDAKGNSSAGQTISATPAASSSTPTVDTPTVDTPTVDTPTVDTPTVDTPTVDTPTVDTPTVDTPTVDTPTVTTYSVTYDGNGNTGGSVPVDT